MTEFLREVRFLTEKGIKYTFVRKTPDYGVSQFKYRKTPALFAALVEFYSIIEAERLVRRRQLSAAEGTKEETPNTEEKTELTAEEIKKAQEILERAAAAIKTEETDDTL